MCEFSHKCIIFNRLFCHHKHTLTGTAPGCPRKINMSSYLLEGKACCQPLRCANGSSWSGWTKCRRQQIKQHSRILPILSGSLLKNSYLHLRLDCTILSAKKNANPKAILGTFFQDCTTKSSRNISSNISPTTQTID